VDLDHREAQKAIEDLKPAQPYELAGIGGDAALVTVYVRGQAYLAAHQGSEAAAEFQKILDHKGRVTNCSLGTLAYLQLARSYALAGDREKARAALQHFLTTWKDADPDIPIYKQPTSEYAKLQ